MAAACGLHVACGRTGGQNATGFWRRPPRVRAGCGPKAREEVCLFACLWSCLSAWRCLWARACAFVDVHTRKACSRGGSAIPLQKSLTSFLSRARISSTVFCRASCSWPNDPQGGFGRRHRRGRTDGSAWPRYAARGGTCRPEPRVRCRRRIRISAAFRAVSGPRCLRIRRVSFHRSCARFAKATSS